MYFFLLIDYWEEITGYLNQRISRMPYFLQGVELKHDPWAVERTHASFSRGLPNE